jgi:hypothetical protein
VHAAKKLRIQGEAGLLECQLRLAATPKAIALFAHPHPLYGGTMDNPIIYRSARRVHQLGISTLCFNFRGAGKSQGTHNHGHGEIEDLETCSRWLKGLLPGLPLVFIGYSFGAWCAFRALKKRQLAELYVAIGLPLLKYDFAEIHSLDLPIGIVQAQFDEFGTATEIRNFLGENPAHIQVAEVLDSDHLFTGKSVAAAEQIGDIVERLFERHVRGVHCTPRSHTP